MSEPSRTSEAANVQVVYPRKINCMNCGGSGYVARLGGDGMKRPIKCKGCDGTGKQVVR